MAQDVIHPPTESPGDDLMATFAGACLVIIVLECARRTPRLHHAGSRAHLHRLALAGQILPYGHCAPRLFPRAYLQKFLATDLDGLFGTTMSVSAT